MKHYKSQRDLESKLFSNAHGTFIQSNHILGKHNIRYIIPSVVLPKQVLNTEVNAMTLTYLFTFIIKKYSTICVRIILLQNSALKEIKRTIIEFLETG